MQRYLRVSEVLTLAGISRTTLYRWLKLGIFPKRHQLGPGLVGFVEEEVREWLANRPEVGDGGGELESNPSTD